MRVRQLTTWQEFTAVFALEHEVWGYATSEDAVPVPLLAVCPRIGAILLGAFDADDRLAGALLSLPALAAGRLSHWSYMLGVRAPFRGLGIGWQLKLEQRRLALEAGVELVEWTFDPLQAMNAHFNFTKLGARAAEYEENVYGDSASPLHQGTATDRLIVQWWLRSPAVTMRVAARAGEGAAPGFDPAAVRAVNEVKASGEWLAPARHDLELEEPRLAVVIPTGFTGMQREQLGLAREWRAATRDMFTAYLRRRYQVSAFALDRDAGRGTYLLVRHEEP